MRSRAQSGFTLLEVVVAFLVLALVMASVFEVYNSALARTADQADRSEALAIAQSRLQATGSDGALKEGDAAGESADRRFRWATSVKRYDEPGAGAGSGGIPMQAIYVLFHVETRVVWAGRDGKERDLSLATMALGPRPT
jgi:general secretion pathway protein I